MHVLAPRLVLTSKRGGVRWAEMENDVSDVAGSGSVNERKLK